MDSPGKEFVLRFRLASGLSYRNKSEWNHIFGNPKNAAGYVLANGLRIERGPDGAEPEGIGCEQEVLAGERGIDDRVFEFPFIGPRRDGANYDGGWGLGRHFGVWQFRREGVQSSAIVDDDKIPGLLVHCGRSSHGGLEKRIPLGIGDGIRVERPYAGTVEDSVEERFHHSLHPINGVVIGQ